MNKYENVMVNVMIKMHFWLPITYLCWYFKNIGSWGINKGWNSQDDQRLNGASGGRRRNNLYYLKGSTVTGQVATSTDTDDDSTRLWHMRLGHTGEKFLQALTK